MKCVIPGPNIKVATEARIIHRWGFLVQQPHIYLISKYILGRAIHSLAKLGEDLYLESTTNELFFRTVNISKTAYASYSFSSDFFSYFNSDSDGKNGSVTCQISMRSALSVFRSPLTLDKTTESIQIQFHQKSDKIIFTVKYKKGVIKTFNVPVIECEALQAYYHKDSSPNSITIQPKIVNDILNNFQNNQDEITWKVTKNSMVIKNFSEPEDDCKGIRTEICVDKDEFDKFQIENEAEITFCLKELRAVLMFSDSVSLPLTANFNVCSKPIVFVIKSDSFEVNIVVSTMSGPDCSVSSKQNNEKNGECRDINHSEANDNSLEENSSRETGRSTGVEKLKKVFQRCFNKETCDIRALPGYDVVLASDSDSES